MNRSDKKKNWLTLNNINRILATLKYIDGASLYTLSVEFKKSKVAIRNWILKTLRQLEPKIIFFEGIKFLKNNQDYIERLNIMLKDCEGELIRIKE